MEKLILLTLCYLGIALDSMKRKIENQFHAPITLS